LSPKRILNTMLYNLEVTRLLIKDTFKLDHMQNIHTLDSQMDISKRSND
jgi:hypothetical protein